jgi:hypothetical protein
MDQTALQEWQRLHHRAVCGETLSNEEQALYLAGLRELEQSERIGTITVDRIREMRQKIRKLDSERLRLEDEVRRLEAGLDEQTRQQLAQVE